MYVDATVSQIFMYTFISLFIYVVLNVFIAIIEEAFFWNWKNRHVESGQGLDTVYTESEANRGRQRDRSRSSTSTPTASPPPEEMEDEREEGEVTPHFLSRSVSSRTRHKSSVTDPRARLRPRSEFTAEA